LLSFTCIIDVGCVLISGLVMPWFVNTTLNVYLTFMMLEQVLDLMVRMLGFSDEDKQRIGVAQQGASKGVVRGVLGLPGRLVGGILGGSSSEAAANAGSDNQVISSPLGSIYMRLSSYMYFIKSKR
jgi:hypothetical protein